MNHEDAFLADIVEHPSEDAPRLVYADWLDERGRPGDADRAEFIRLQCELVRLPDIDPRKVPLSERGRQLLAAHESAWVGELRGLVEGGEFRRGFRGD
jgi:uncharacterized protein (TIGR02996 family)